MATLQERVARQQAEATEVANRLKKQKLRQNGLLNDFDVKDNDPRRRRALELIDENGEPIYCDQVPAPTPRQVTFNQLFKQRFGHELEKPVRPKPTLEFDQQLGRSVHDMDWPEPRHPKYVRIKGRRVPWERLDTIQQALWFETSHVPAHVRKGQRTTTAEVKKARLRQNERSLRRERQNRRKTKKAAYREDD